MSKEEVEKAVNARKADGSPLEYGLNWQLDNFLSNIKSGIPTDDRFIDDYLKKMAHHTTVLRQWLDTFVSQYGSSEHAQPYITRVNDAFAAYEANVGSKMTNIEIDKYIKARRADGSVLEYGLKYELDQLASSLKSGVPSDSRYVDDYLKKVTGLNSRLIQWLEGFKERYASNPYAHATIAQVETALAEYKSFMQEKMAKVNIDKHVLLKKSEGGILENSLKWHLEKINNGIKSGIPKDSRYVDDYLTMMKTQANLLTQWLEDFKSKYGEVEYAHQFINQVEEALASYKKEIGAGMVNVEIDKFIAARRADGSILEYGLKYELEQMTNGLKSGVPSDDRYVDDYLKKMTGLNSRLSQWIEEFKSKYGAESHAQPTIEQVETSLADYRKFMKEKMTKVNIDKHVNAKRAEGSILEYSLKWHLEKLNNGIKSGIPKDSRFVDEYLNMMKTQSSLLIQWLEDFKAKYGEEEYAQQFINQVEEALASYKKEIGSGMINVEIDKFIAARRADGSILEYGLKYELEQMTNGLKSGVPTDDRYVDDYLKKMTGLNSRLAQWLEDFKAKYGSESYAQDTIVQVENALAEYKTFMKEKMTKVNIDKHVNAKRADGSILEYSLKWHLDKINNGVKEGIPKDSRFVDDFLNMMKTQSGLLIQWLEDFKAKYGEEDYAQQFINQVEEALASYKKEIGSGLLKVEIDKFIAARRADGSILEYGLKYELEQMTNGLKSGVPTDDRYVDDYFKKMTGLNSRLAQWLEDFKAKYGGESYAQDTIVQVENALNEYRTFMKEKMTKVNIDKHVNAKRAEGSILEYSLKWHLEKLNNGIKAGIPKDSRFVDEYLNMMKTQSSLLIQWLEDFKAKYGDVDYAQQFINQVEEALAHYKKDIGSSLINVEIDKFIDARRADGSILEYGLKYELEQMANGLKSGVPSDDRFVDDYLKKMTGLNSRLAQWLEDFKAKYGGESHAQDTITKVENALAEYKTFTKEKMGKVNIDKHVIAKRADGSILEYSLKWHLEQINNGVKAGIPTDARHVDEYLNMMKTQSSLLIQWLEDFKAKYGEDDYAQQFIIQVEEALASYKKEIGSKMIMVEIDKAVAAKRADGSVLEYGLRWELEQIRNGLKSGVPTDDRYVDDYLKKMSDHNNRLVQWLETFKSNYGEEPHAQSFIQDAEAALSEFKAFFSTKMSKIYIDKHLIAKRAEGSILEYSLKWHLEQLANGIKSGIPTDSRYVDEYLNKMKSNTGLLLQWLEDFKAKYGDVDYAQQYINQVEEALAHYKKEIVPKLINVEIDKAVSAKRAEGSVLEYGLRWELEQVRNGIKSGVPTDSRYVDDYIKKMADHNSRLVQWLEVFKSNYGDQPHAQPFIQDTEAALAEYKAFFSSKFSKIYIDKHVQAKRAEGSILEYSLKWHLEQVHNGIKAGIPTDARYVDEFLNKMKTQNSLLVQWLEDFKAKYGDEEYAQQFIQQVEEALASYKKEIVPKLINVEIDKAVAAKRADGSILEYGLNWELEQVNNGIKGGLPSDHNKVDDYLKKMEAHKNRLVQWLEDFKSRYEMYEKASESIKKTEETLAAYKSFLGAKVAKINIDKMVNARRADGSILEYGLNYEVEQQDKAITAGIPKDERQVDTYLDNLAKRNGRLRQWLEEFKLQYDEEEYAYQFINKVEAVMKRYQEDIMTKMVPVLMNKARAARKADGSILEYGLKNELDNFLSAIEKGIPTDQRHVDEFLLTLNRRRSNLIQWLEGFKSEYGDYKEAAATIQEVQDALSLFKSKIGSKMTKVAVDKARVARRADGSLLEYGFDNHVRTLKEKLDQGLPPKADVASQWLADVSKLNSALVQWTETFRSTYGEDEEAQATLQEAETILRRYSKVVGGARITQELQTALADRALLSNGLDWHLQKVTDTLARQKSTKVSPQSSDYVLLQQQQSLLIRFVEDFKARFAYVDGAQATIEKVHNVLKKCQDAIGAPPPSASSSSGDNNNNNAAEGGAAASGGVLQRKYAYVYPIPIPVPSEKSNNNNNDAASALTSAAPSPADTSSSSSSTPDGAGEVPSPDWAQALVKELAKKEAALRDALGKQTVALVVDWSFAHSLTDEEQKKIASPIAYGIASKLISGDEGLVGLAEKNKIVKQALVANVSKVRLAYDSSNGVKSTVGDANYEITLDTSTGLLTILINISSAASGASLGPIEPKLDAVLQLTLKKAMSNVDLNKSSIENTLAFYVGKVIPVIFDLSFLEHPSLGQNVPQATRAAMVDKLVAVTKKWLNAEKGFGEFSKNGGVLDIVASRVLRIRVSANPENTIASKIGDAHYDIRYANEGELIFRINVSDLDKAINSACLEAKFENALNLTIFKVVEASRAKITGLENTYTKKIAGKTILLEIDWSWASNESFTRLPVSEQSAIANKLVGLFISLISAENDSLITLMEKNADMRGLVQRVLIRYDPLNKIDDKTPRTPADWRATIVEGELILEGNMSAYNAQKWEGLAAKVTPQLESELLYWKMGTKVSEIQKQLSSAVSSPYTLSFDRDFLRSQAFLALPRKDKEDYVQSIFATHLDGFVKTIKSMSEHPIGKTGLSSQVSSVSMVMRSDVRAPACKLEEKNLTVRLPARKPVLAEVLPVISVQWALGVLVPIEKSIGQDKIQETVQKCNDATGCKLVVNLDWSFVEKPAFLANSPETIRDTIHRLSRDLVRRILLDGVVDVCAHPIGKKTLQEKLAHVDISAFNPEKGTERTSRVAIKGDRLVVSEIHVANLDAAIKSRYKERIEFEYDLIVAIAKDNATAKHNEVVKRMSEICGKSIPIAVDFAFTSNSSFKSMDPAEQADIITGIYATLPENVLVKADGTSLAADLVHEVAKTAFLNRVEKIEFCLELTPGKAANDGDIIIDASSKTLRFIFNMNEVVSVVHLNNWKERLADKLDVLPIVALEETKDKRDAIEYEVQRALASKTKVTLDTTFVTSADFVKRHPTEKVRMVKDSNTTLLASLLHGDSGLTGPLSLSEFPSVAKSITDRVKEVRIVVAPARAPLAHRGDVLDVTVSLEDVKKGGKVDGIHGTLEELLKLRSIKEDAVIERANAVLANVSKQLSEAVGKQIPVEIDWNSVRNAASFKSNAAGYVAFIKQLSTFPEINLVTGTGAWGGASIVTVCKRNPAVMQKLVDSVDKIVITFEAKNNVDVHIGKSRSLNPSGVSVKLNGKVLEFTENLDSPLSCGVGRCVHNLFAQSEFLAAEQKVVNDIADDMRQQEENRRAREMERAHDHNKRAQEQYAHDQERYQRAMQDYHKELNEACRNCDGKRDVKCNYCAGKGTTTNNNNVSACQVCKGPGRHTCTYCDGSGKAHKSVNQPNPPSALRLESIPSFGSMPDYRSQI